MKQRFALLPRNLHNSPRDDREHEVFRQSALEAGYDGYWVQLGLNTLRPNTKFNLDSWESHDVSHGVMRCADYVTIELPRAGKGSEIHVVKHR